METSTPIAQEYEVVLDFVTEGVAPLELEQRTLLLQDAVDQHVEGIVDGAVVACDFKRSSIELAFSHTGHLNDVHHKIAEVVEVLQRESPMRALRSSATPVERESVCA